MYQLFSRMLISRLEIPINQFFFDILLHYIVISITLEGKYEITQDLLSAMLVSNTVWYLSWFSYHYLEKRMRQLQRHATPNNLTHFNFLYKSNTFICHYLYSKHEVIRKIWKKIIVLGEAMNSKYSSVRQIREESQSRANWARVKMKLTS